MKLQALYEEKEEAVKNQDFERARELQKQQDEAEEQIEKARKRFEKQCKNKKLTVTQEHVALVVAEWTKIPVKKLTEGESKRLAKLENVLHKRVIGQNEAVEAVSKAIKRGRVGLKDPKRPIGSFLLLGPTGVGKTELSKALAEAVFGSEDAMIRWICQNIWRNTACQNSLVPLRDMWGMKKADSSVRRCGEILTVCFFLMKLKKPIQMCLIFSCRYWMTGILQTPGTKNRL